MFIPENYSELKPKKFRPKNVLAQPGFLGDERKRHKNLSVSLSIISIKLSFGRNKIWTTNVAMVELCVNSVLKNEKVVVAIITVIVVVLLLYFQVLGLLKYLVIDNQNHEYLYQAIKLLDPFPDHPHFKELRATQQKIKYSTGRFSLLQVITSDLKNGIQGNVSYC